MNQISSHPLWLGHAADGRDFPRLLDTGIAAVVQLAAEDPALQPPRDLIYCRFPILDGTGNAPTLLSLATRTVAALLSSRVPTLVFCTFGMCRAPVIAAAALSIDGGEPPEDCLKRVMAHHPSDVSPVFWNEVFELLPTLR